MGMNGGKSKLVFTGYGNGNRDFPIKLYVYYKTKQNITENTSTITCGLYVTTPSEGWYIGPWSDFFGSYVGSKSNTFEGSIPQFGGTKWLAENLSFKVNHSADGTGKATIYWKWGVNSPWGKYVNPSGSFSIDLPTIPRASSISVTGADIGSEAKISINKASTAFTHTLTYSYAGLSGVIAEKTNESNIFWTIPTTFYPKIANARSGEGKITCVTFNGNAELGTKVSDFTFTVNESKSKPLVNPVITDLRAETIALTGDANTIVKNQSNAGITMGIESRNAASIISKMASCGDASIKADGNIDLPQSGKFIITATDSRGFSTTKVINKTFIEYIKLSCSIKCANITTDGRTKLSISGSYFNGSFGAVSNTLKLQYRYKVNGESFSSWFDFTSLNLATNSYSAEADIIDLNYQNTYTFQGRATDKLNAIYSAPKTVKSIPVFDWGKEDFKFNVPVILHGKQLLSAGKCGLDLNNSDLINCNGLYTNDEATTPKEGINFYRDGTNWDSLYGNDGKLLFNPNYPAETEKFEIYHSGNHGNKVLWEGVSQVLATDTLTLADTISRQAHGIILVFGAESGNFAYNTFTISKAQVASFAGKGHTFPMVNNMAFGTVGAKYLYITDTTITGNASNNSNGVGGSGIKYNNAYFVLKRVIGV